MHIRGEAYTWAQEESVYIPGSKEYGAAVVVSEDNIIYYIIAELLMYNFLFNKERNFPEWGGKPRFIIGPVTISPTIKKIDGKSVAKKVQKMWDKFSEDKLAWQEDNDWDSYPHTFTLPVGYKIEYVRLHSFAWHVIV